MSRVRFWSYGPSNGLNNLKTALKDAGINTMTLKREGSRFQPRADDIIINWGSQVALPQSGGHVLNDPSKIYRASNKLKAFQHMWEHDDTSDNLPEFTTDKRTAEQWVRESIVYCRTELSAHSGEGIVVAHDRGEIVEAPLYTRGVAQIEREVRVHVFNGIVIDFAQKKKMNSERREEEGVELDEEIRNHANGYVFARSGVELPDSVKELSIKTIAAMGLEFGSIDILITRNEPIILEVNTASGMEGTTVERYVSAIKSFIEEVN